MHINPRSAIALELIYPPFEYNYRRIITKLNGLPVTLKKWCKYMIIIGKRAYPDQP